MLHEVFEFGGGWEVLEVGDAFVVVLKFGECTLDFVFLAVVGVESECFADVVGDDDGDCGGGSAGVANRSCKVHADVLAALVHAVFDFNVDDAVKG